MKIKFIDSGEVIEVTRAEQLFNTSFQSENPEQIESIESLGFKRWIGSDIDGSFICLWEDVIYTRDCAGFEMNFRKFQFLPSPILEGIGELDQQAAAVQNLLEELDHPTTTIPAAELAILIKQLSYAMDALKDIRDWNEDMEDAWDDQGDRAAQALKAINRLTLPKTSNS